MIAMSGTMEACPKATRIFRAAARLRAALVGKQRRRPRGTTRSTRPPRTRTRHRDHRGRRRRQAPPRALRRRARAAHAHADDRRVARLPPGRALAPTRSHRAGRPPRRRRHDRGVLRGADRRAAPRPRRARPSVTRASRMLERLGPDLCERRRRPRRGRGPARARSTRRPSSPPRSSTNGSRPGSATSSSRRSAGRNASSRSQRSARSTSRPGAASTRPRGANSRAT